MGGNLAGTDPGFVDAPAQDFTLVPGSTCEDAGGPLAAAVLPDHAPVWQYVPHQRATARPDDGARDLGAFEIGLVFADDFESGSSGAWSSIVG